MGVMGYMVELDVGRFHAEVQVNGWPALRNIDPAGRVTNQKINPWLLDGDNVISVHLGPIEGSSEAPEACRVSVWKVEGDDHYIQAPPWLFYRWTAEEYPLFEEGLRMVYEHRFHMQKAFGPWQWTSASPYLETDRPAIEALVTDLYNALAARDRDRLIELMKLRLEELGRALGRSYDEMVEAQNTFFDDLLAGGISLPPLDLDNLSLRSGAAGRLVQVEREGGDLRALRFLSAAGVAAALPICVSNIGGTYKLVR